MIRVKGIALGVLLASLAVLAHAVFVLPPEITVSGRIDPDGTLRTDVVQDGVATRTLPVITLTGAQYVNLTVGGTYSEQGATCADAVDGSITVAAPTFSPALNVNAQGTYAATYSCTNTAPATVTAVRYINVLPTQLAGWGGGPQSSTKAQEWGFDFVEEFDGLQDWNQSALGGVGNQFETTTTGLAWMPKLADGTPSAWGYFSLWASTGTYTHSWIGGTEGGTRQVWRGTKSASIDLGESEKGPSRFGLFFGETGYKDFSVFYMFWMPKNNFPTSCASPGCSSGGLGTYTEGQPYEYWAAYKFNTFSMECNSVNCPLPNGPAYGDHYFIGGLKQYNYTPNGVLPHVANYGPEQQYSTDAGITLNSLFGSWMGIEYRIRNNDVGTAYTLDIWVYDQNGVSSHMLQNETFTIENDTAHGGSWDKFFFGGNNSNSWQWGPTMVSHYYVDDFIVDAGSKGRIGPRYFSLIGD